MTRGRSAEGAVLAAAGFLLIPGAASAEAAAGLWVDAGKARIRLVAEGIDASGRLVAGLEIALSSMVGGAAIQPALASGAISIG